MGRKCCVPGCNVNNNAWSDNVQLQLSVFSFPKDENLKMKWLDAVARTDDFKTKNAGVCILHFDESAVKKNRINNTLIKGAVPTIFFYSEIESLTKDIIKDFEDFKRRLSDRLILSGDWQFKIHENGVHIFKISVDDSYGVFVEFNIIVGLDLCIKVYHKNRLLEPNFYKGLIKSDSRLGYFSEIKSLTKKCEENIPDSIELILKNALNSMKKAQKLISDSQLDFDYENVIAVIVDQLLLLTQKKRKYSTDTILYAYSIFLQSKACYTLIRDEKMLILPHISTLSSITRFQNISAGNESSNKNYFKKIVSNLTDLEKVVTIQIDEIYCAAQINFKASSLTGFAENTDEVAKTVVCVFNSSCKSFRKEL